MGVIFFFLSHLSVIGLLLITCYIFGYHLTRRIEYDSYWEQASFSITLGLGIVAYLILLLSLTGLLYKGYLLALLVLGLLACYQTWSSWFRNALLLKNKLKTPDKNSLMVAAFVALIFICCLPYLILTFYPPTAFDATMYHLPYARSYVQSHQLVFTPYLRFPVFPQTNDMLFTLALLLDDDIFAQLIEFLMMVVLTMALIGFGRRFFSRRAGWWAAALFLCSPMVIWLGTIPYIDMGLALFTTMAIYAVWIWFKDQTKHWLILAGIFFGLAIGTKYTAIFFLAILTVAIFYISIRKRQYLQPVLFLALAILIPSPWFLRNYYYMHNPVFPFFYEAFGKVFGYGVWKPEHFQGVFSYQLHAAMGRGLKQFVLLPWNLAVHWKIFGEGRVSAICFFVPQLLFIAGIGRQKIKWLLAIGLAYLLIWFFTLQESRYLLPVLPVLSLATAAAVDSLLLKFSFLSRWTSHRIITVLGILLLLGPSCKWAFLTIRGLGPVPVTKEQRQSYLAQQLWIYPAYQFLNNRKGSDYTVYALADENMNYFADGKFIGDHFGLGRYSEIVDTFSDGEMLFQKLRGFGAQYFLIRPSFVPEDSLHRLIESKSFTDHFQLIYNGPDALLYEMN